MQQARYSPVVGQGIISGKAFVDHRRIEEARINAQDGGALLGCYPGGESDDNLSIMPGELSFGIKEDRMMRHMMGGMANESGLTSLAGHSYSDFYTDEGFMDNFYFQGVVDTEFRVGSGNDPQHGYAFSRAGSKTINNNGPGDIYAGDLVAYRAPLTPKSASNNGSSGTSLDSIVFQNRAGTPNTKYLWEVHRFDYTDFTSQLTGSYAAMRSNQYDNDPGIADLPIERFWERSGTNDSKALTNLQSQAMGYKYGLLSVGLTVVEHLLRLGVLTYNPGALQDDPNLQNAPAAATNVRNIATDIYGLFVNNPNGQARQNELFADIFLRNLPKGLAERTLAETRFLATHVTAANIDITGGNAWRNISKAYNDNDATRFMRMRANQMEILCSGIAGSWYSKTSKIIGKAMNTAKRSGQLHLVLGHFKL